MDEDSKDTGEEPAGASNPGADGVEQADDAWARVVSIARQTQPGSPAGWLLGVAFALLVLEDKLERPSLERIARRAIDEIFEAVNKQVS